MQKSVYEKLEGTVTRSPGNKLQSGFLIINTILTFLYNINIEGFEKLQQKIKLPPMGFKLTTATITGLEF